MLNTLAELKVARGEDMGQFSAGPIKTRNSAIADKRRDRGQSMSPNMVPFDPYVRYGFLLLCYSNFVPKMYGF